MNTYMKNCISIKLSVLDRVGTELLHHTLAKYLEIDVLKYVSTCLSVQRLEDLAGLVFEAVAQS